MPVLKVENLGKKGVNVLDYVRMLLQCQYCETLWTPHILPGRRFYKAYWHCPNECNLTIKRR